MSTGTTHPEPSNWTNTTLGAVTEEKVGQTGPKGDADFVYIDISSIDNKVKRIVAPKTLPVGTAPSRAKQNLKAGDVLVSMTRPNLNAVAMLPPEFEGAVASTGFHVLRAKDAEPSWLFYAVQTNDFVDAMSRLVQGALYPAVRPKDIRAYPLLLAPLSEQQQIVAEIEKQFTRLEAGVAALRRVQANLKRYRAAVLKAAWSPPKPNSPASPVAPTRPSPNSSPASSPIAARTGPAVANTKNPSPPTPPTSQNSRRVGRGLRSSRYQRKSSMAFTRSQTTFQRAFHSSLSGTSLLVLA